MVLRFPKCLCAWLKPLVSPRGWLRVVLPDRIMRGSARWLHAGGHRWRSSGDLAHPLRAVVWLAYAADAEAWM